MYLKASEQTQPVSGGPCDTDWLANNYTDRPERCYFVNRSARITLAQAVERCQLLGATLLSVQDQLETNFLWDRDQSPGYVEM